MKVYIVQDLDSNVVDICIIEGKARRLCKDNGYSYTEFNIEWLSLEIFKKAIQAAQEEALDRFYDNLNSSNKSSDPEIRVKVCLSKTKHEINREQHMTWKDYSDIIRNKLP